MTTETSVKRESSFAGLKAAIRANSPKKPEPTPVVAPPAHRPYVRKPKPLRRVGTIGDLAAFGGFPRSGFTLDRDGAVNAGRGYPAAIIHTRGRPVAAGVEQMIARLATYGVRLAASPKGQTYVLTERGAMPPELREQIVALWPILAAFVQGHPLVCAWCKDDAVDLLLGGAPVCGVHSDEQIRP